MGLLRTFLPTSGTPNWRPSSLFQTVSEVEFSEVGTGLGEVASCLWWKVDSSVLGGSERRRRMRFLVQARVFETIAGKE
jgi:hypothetical protein